LHCIVIGPQAADIFLLGYFHGGVARFPRLVADLIINISNLKNISKLSALPPPGKISADANAQHIKKVTAKLYSFTLKSNIT